MRPSIHETALALTGAFRLARFDAGGLALFDASAEGALRSFWAAALVLPPWALLELVRRWDQLDDTGLLRLASVEAIGYVISWTAFPVLMVQICRLIGRNDRFAGYLCAHNWAVSLQFVVLLPVALLVQIDLLPEQLSAVVWLVSTLAILFYDWFVARAGLLISGSMAVAVVILDVLLDVLVNDLTDALL